MDVVSNMVGILIILVMVVGVRAQHAPQAQPQRDHEAEAEMMRLRARAASHERDLLRLIESMAQVQNDLAIALVQRSQLAEVAAAARGELEQRRRRLDQQSQEDFALRNELAAAELRLEQLELENARAQTIPEQVVRIENRPTPISSTVDGREVHFQLRDGRVIYVPVEPLLERLKSDARSQLWKLREQAEVTSSVGPIDGFRMRYTMQRVDVMTPDPSGLARPGTYAQLAEWTLVPVAGDLGETLEESLGATSQLRTVLASRDPRITTVTLWAYPDSFEAFRILKQELQGLGYSTAGRPLPDGVSIGGSPQGTKSAAE